MQRPLGVTLSGRGLSVERCGMDTAATSPIETEAAERAGADEPIDLAYLARFTLGNTGLEREILELFAGQMPRYVEQLRAADSRTTWELAAHTIKGSALAVGAHKLARLAQMAERLDVGTGATDGVGAQAAEAVAAASDEVCCYIACRFATA